MLEGAGGGWGVGGDITWTMALVYSTHSGGVGSAGWG